MKKQISLVLALVMILGTFSTVLAADPVEAVSVAETEAGEFLETVGVLKGYKADGELGLEDNLLRQETLALLSRLMGEVEEAENFADEVSYEDVNDPYYVPLAAWAKDKGTFIGHSDLRFGFNDNLTGQEYSAVLLRTLDYDVGEANEEVDVLFKDALERAKELDILEGVDVEDATEITRGQMALMTFNALNVNMKDLDKTLANTLQITMPDVDEEVTAEEVVEMIKALPLAKNITLEDKEDVEAARAAFDALTEEEQALVSNLFGLENREAKIAELEEEDMTDEEAAEEVVEMIKDLTFANKVTLEDKEDIEAARAAYDALSDEAKELVTNLNGLENREAKIVELEEEQVDPIVEALELAEEAIAKLPNVDEVTLEDKAAVVEARALVEAVKALDADQYVAKEELLGALEIKVADLEEIEEVEDKEAAEKVDIRILEIHFSDATQVTEADRDVVEAARTAYNALNDEAKDLVVHLDHLERLEEALADFEVPTPAEALKAANDAADALPAVEDLKLSDKAAVEAARVLHDTAWELNKPDGTGLEGETLLAAEKEIARLQDLIKKANEAAEELPAVEDLKLSDEAAVEAARVLHDTAWAANKPYGTDLEGETLLAAEAQIVVLKDAE